MKRASIYLFAVAVILLALTYFFPIWRITLSAPQYPEGLGLYIWLDTIRGIQPQDLRNINGLNHYIGMRPIVPSSIPELKYLPYIVGFLIGFGLLTLALRSKKLLASWVILLCLLSLVGLADFYKWGYDYGHNLDLEHAAIKIPNMAYQPPVIGTKKLLNFTAGSYPAAGGWMLIGSLTLGMVALAEETRWHPISKILKREAA